MGGIRRAGKGKYWIGRGGDGGVKRQGSRGGGEGWGRREEIGCVERMKKINLEGSQWVGGDGIGERGLLVVVGWGGGGWVRGEESRWWIVGGRSVDQWRDSDGHGGGVGVAEWWGGGGGALSMGFGGRGSVGGCLGGRENGYDRGWRDSGDITTNKGAG